ncbi:MAG: hypothetical protein JWM98_2198 [Thermoleophilia bacterium]|nr:hypothetical protein [Thermoleophilia bacterium]
MDLCHTTAGGPGTYGRDTMDLRISTHVDERKLNQRFTRASVDADTRREQPGVVDEPAGEPADERGHGQEPGEPAGGDPIG